MNKTQWDIFSDTVRGASKNIPVAAIVDSPWIPGYCGHSFLDFYGRPNVWFDCYKKIHEDFPSVLFFSDWWVEYGMTAEPSGFGARLRFFEDNMPTVYPRITSIETARQIIDLLPTPDPYSDGLMPLILNAQRFHMPQIEALGQSVPMVSARGPFTIASHLFQMTELLVCILEEPEIVQPLLRKTTELCKNWLRAQLKSVPTAGAVMVLDDVCGFLDADTFNQIALPCFKEIFEAFPGMIHMFHNDTTRDSCYTFLEEMGVDVFNFSHENDIGRVRRAVGDRIVLMGNVPPMSLSRKTPEEVYTEAMQVLERYCQVNGGPERLLLSVGGGVPMGATGENLLALVRAAEDFNARI